MTEPDPPPHEHVGSLSDEAAKLITALQDWARRTTGEAPIATGAPECEWCPVCQLVAALRGDPSALAERAGEIARTVVSGLVAAFATTPASPASGGESRARRVERIDLFGMTMDEEAP
jgi:hypothetical protein